MSNFIEDFLSFNCGTECPKNYLRWSAISAIGIAAGLRYYLKQGRITVRSNGYTALIGDQGNRKSYAKDQIRALIEEALPDHPIGADITTRDDLVKTMSSEDCERAFKNAEGIEGVIYHPLTLFVNELKHFLSYSPSSMISFLVDIYDRDYFRGSTIKRGREEIDKPCLNIVACENTDWLVNSLKIGIITGGFSRRFVVVYEPENNEVIIPRPYLPDNHKVLWDRMVSHLRNVQGQARVYQWEPDALKYFDEWYTEHKKNMPDDKIIRGFMRTKDQQMLRVVIMLDLAESSPKYKITVEGIEHSLALFDVIEPNMPKLYMAAGRNELAMPQGEMLEMLRAADGVMFEKDFLRRNDKNLNPQEKRSVMLNLNALGYLYRVKAASGTFGKNMPEGFYFITNDRLVSEAKKGVKLQQVQVI